MAAPLERDLGSRVGKPRTWETARKGRNPKVRAESAKGLLDPGSQESFALVQPNFALVPEAFCSLAPKRAFASSPKRFWEFFIFGWVFAVWAFYFHRWALHELHNIPNFTKIISKMI